MLAPVSLPAAACRPACAQAAPGPALRAAFPLAARRQPRQQLQLRRLRSPGAAAVDVDMPMNGVHIESIEYDGVGGCYSVQGCLLSPASPDLVYQVLTDYDALPRVFHNIETSQVRHCSATGALQLVQTCKWAFLVFSGTFVTELNVQEEPAQRQLTFSLIQSAFMKEFVGSWDVRPGAGGMTEVRHRLSVRPAVAPPQRIGDITCNIFRKQVASILEDLQEELERI